MIKYDVTSRDDGLTLITVPMPQAETITSSLMFQAGARYEKPGKWGISHFLEHMLFNGTEKYPNSKALSEDLDTLGAIQNAYTWQEVVSLWTKAAHTAADKIFEIIAEGAIHPVFSEDGIEKEHKVVREELEMNRNHHESWLGREYQSWLLCNQKPALDPLGREDTIENFTRQDVVDHFQLFSPKNGVSVVAGAMTHDEHSRLADKYYQFKNQGDRISNEDIDINQLAPEKSLLISRPEMTQAHVELGTALPGVESEDIPAFRILNTILSGGMSTRLFQELREKNHLCYSVYSSGIYFSDFGLWTISGGMNVDNIDKAVELMLTEIRKLREEKIDEQEMNKAKTNIRGKLSIASEDTQFLSDFFARHFLSLGRIKTVDDIFKENEKVTAEDVMHVAQKYLSPDRLHLGVIGPFPENKNNDFLNLMNKA